MGKDCEFWEILSRAFVTGLPRYLSATALVWGTIQRLRISYTHKTSLMLCSGIALQRPLLGVYVSPIPRPQTMVEVQL